MTLRCNVTKYPKDHDSRLSPGIICIAQMIYQWQEPGIPVVYQACKRCMMKIFGRRCTERLLKMEEITKHPNFTGLLLPDTE